MRKVLTISIVLLQIMSGVYAQTEITTAEQFRQMKTDGNYILMSDIDLSTKPFVPIGGYNGSFSGTFDGNGHTITIGGISSSLDFYYRGLFAKIASEGVVKNLIVKGFVDNSEESASQVGAIAGANYGTIINCVSYADVNSGGILNNNPKSHTTGGIAGVNGGTISYCLVSEKIMGSVWSSGTGGIVGSDSYENTGKIENCIYAADGISVPTNYSSSAMIDAYGMICGDTDGGRGANRTKNCYYIENGTFSGFGDRWGKDVPDDSRCYGLNVDGIRSLVGEGGIYASTEYDIFRNSILKAIAPEWYQNIDTYLTDGYFTFYNGDCNYSVYNNATIYTGIIKNSKVILTALDGTIIPKGVPVVIKSNTRYCSLRKSYKEVSCTCENDLLGADTDISCQSNSNYVLSLENGNAGFRMFSGTTIKANTAYIPWQDDIDDCDFLPIIIRGLSPAITFADANVEAICVANWDTNGDGGLSEAEAAAVTDLGTVFKNNKQITSFDELQYFTGLTSIGTGAFYLCNGLRSVIIPNNVTSIDQYGFCDCSSLTSVTFSNNVTSIGDRAFQGCSGLTTISIPNSVTSIGYAAFSGCSSLTTVSIPNNVTSIVTETFDGCSGLTSVSIPNGVTSIGNSAFRDCSGLTSVTIPNSVTSIIGSYAFKNCTNLTSVISEIEEPSDFNIYAFQNISSTCTLTVPYGTKDAYFDKGWSESFFKGGIVELDNRNEQSMELASLPAKTYGDAAYTLPATTTQGLALTWSSGNTNVATISGNTLTVKGAGTATITASQAGNEEYKPFSKEFTLTVAKAPLTITASDATKNVGDANPAFTASYEGFVGDDDASVLTAQPTFTTKADENSPVGTYAIVVSGAEAANYEINYVNGTLTVVDEWSMSNTISLTDTQVLRGRQVVLPVSMNNTEDITALQFDLTLPAGVSIAVNSKGKYIVAKTERCADHTLSASKPGEANVYKVLLYSTEVESITGNEGAVIHVTIEAAEDMEAGDYEVKLSNINLTTTAEKKITPADVTCVLTVRNSIPGDANGDGEIDVTDIVGIANKILGRASDSFVAAAADVNGDGEVDVTDIVAVANIILRGGGKANSAKVREAFQMLDPH